MSVYFGADIPRQAAARPTAPAIVTPDRTIDFATLERAIEGTAGALRAAGLAPGAVAGIVLHNVPRHLVALLALQRMGVAVLGIAPDEPADARRALLQQAGARVTIADPADAIAGAPTLTPQREWWDHAPSDLPLPGPDTVCYMTRSSGTTTGVSKMVANTHGWEVERITGTLQRIPFGADDRFFALMRFSFAISRDYAIRTLFRGGSVALPPPLRAVSGLLDAARGLGATWTAMTPLHLRDLLRAKEPRPLLPGMKIACSAAMLNPAERRRVMQEVSAALYIVYGANEVGVVSLATPEDMTADIATVGIPEPGIEAEAVDDADEPLPGGAIGRLRFRHPRFALSYLHADPAAASKFVDGWFYPGDLGLIDSAGRIHLRGRVDEVINVGGAKVHPTEIEACLTAHPAVADAVAVALESRRMGEVPAALVVAEGTTEEDLIDHCRARLGATFAPRRIAIVAEIPRSEGGKIDRAALAALAREVLDAGGET